ncbi:MAG: hypothetical protein NTW78_08265 [Campylobacterales bacterium]|nr:hypothetical protein [Campylobacterales bacterium]
MKSVLLLYILASALLAGAFETNKGAFLEIYSDDNFQSNIVATAAIDRGKLEILNCFNTRNDTEWCKITYEYNGLKISGFSDKKSVESVASRMNSKATFEQSYGGRYDDEGNSLLQLKDGFLIVGYTQSFGEGQSDAYIVKVDHFGNKLWSAAYGGGRNDVANAVVAVNDGFMIAGTTGSFGSRVQSLYLARIFNDGSLTWQNGYFSDRDDYYSGEDMVKMNDDNVMIVGAEDHVQFFNSEMNFYVNAIDTKGQRNGIKCYGGDKVENANSVIKVNDGYLIAGETKTWGHGGKDAYVVKIDNDGNQIWHNAYGYRYDEVANQIIATEDGGYIMVGTTNSDNTNQKNIFVAKINNDGTLVWQYHYGTKENDEGFGIVEVNDGYVIAGYTKDTPTYHSDAYLLKIDKAGNTLWSKKYGGERDDAANAIIKVDKGFVITGYTTSSKTYSKDLYLLKVDENGNI